MPPIRPRPSTTKYAAWTAKASIRSIRRRQSWSNRCRWQRRPTSKLFDYGESKRRIENPRSAVSVFRLALLRQREHVHRVAARRRVGFRSQTHLEIGDRTAAGRDRDVLAAPDRERDRAARDLRRK